MAQIATIKDAYQLLHKGSLAFARMEENGKRVDVAYVKSTLKELGTSIKDLKKELTSDPVWVDTWKRLYGDKAQLGSRQQLAQVVFRELGHPAKAKTELTDKDSTEESAFRGIDLPFIGKYFRLQKLQKLRRTYFLNILQEQCRGYVHCHFNLHTVSSYRSSSSEPNYQNIPARDPVLGKLIRKAFIAREGNHLVEMDLAGAEVRVAYCYHLDPTMRDYLLDPGSDMHRDTAAELFFLDKQFLIDNALWAKKTVRDWAKNRFVFPQFYGSVFFQCGPHLWDAVTDRDPDGSYRYKLPDGTPIIEHLKANGIHSLGDKVSDWSSGRIVTKPGTFVEHVRKVENSFWQERFPVYTQWKQRWYRNYQGQGYFDLFTGFRCEGLYSRNQTLNYPVQGAAFHVILLAIILLQEWLDKYDMKTLIVGQIHDSIVLDAPPDELQDVLTALRHIITRVVPKRWKWITIPLEVEAEVCPIGGSWADKKVWTEDKGVWRVKS